LIREYKTSDLFILPSRTEGFGITIIEAMISKVPVIATRC
jgi:glycosyltransferase involved in cell wall biosynthesis